MTTIASKPGKGVSTLTRTAVGEIIRELREKHELSQMSVAELADMNTSYISRIESGDRRPTRDVLKRIAAAMGEDPSRLFIAAGYLPPRITEQIERKQLSIRAVHAVLVEGLLNR